MFSIIFLLPEGSSRRYRRVPRGSVTSPMTPVSIQDSQVHLLPRQPHSVIPEQYFGRNLLSSRSTTAEYKVNKPALCSGRKDVLLLMLVLSQPKDVERRMAIRDTWGSRHHLPPHNRMPLAFILGDSTALTAQMDVASENNIYADIVQGSFIDSSTNLTLKTVMAFQWTRTFCPRAAFVMVATDDVLVDTYKLAPYLQLQHQEEHFALCDLVPCCQPAHSSSASAELLYAGKVYPTHCAGHAFVLPSSVISRMHSASLHTPLFTPHEVFVGVLAEKLGVTFRDTSLFFAKNTSLEQLVQHPSYVDSPLMVAVVQHTSTLRRHWWNILDQHMHTPKAHAPSPPEPTPSPKRLELWLLLCVVLLAVLSGRKKLLPVHLCR